MAGDPELRAQLRLDGGLGSGDGAVRRAHLHLRHRRHLGDRARPRDAALDRDRALPDRDRAAAGSPPRSRRWSSCSPRFPSVVLGLWGILVFGPWVRDHLEPWIQATPSGSSPSSREIRSQAGILPAALVLTIMIIPITSAICRELFIRVPQRPDGRRARPRLDPLGVDPRRDARLRRPGDRRRSAARARTRVRRGDRRQPDDRQPQRHPDVVVRAGGLARQQGRLRVRRRDEPRAGVRRSSTSPRSSWSSRS